MQELIDPRLETDSYRSLLAGVKKANQILRDVIGPSDEKVSVNWQIAPDNHKPHLRLIIAKPPDEIKAKIAPEEFQDENRLRGTLIRLWGDVLEVRSHRLLLGLLELEETTQS